MDLPVGRIISVAPGRATVSVEVSSACARCAAGKGCGAGLLGGGQRSSLLDVHVATDMDLKVGERVSLSLAPSQLLRAACLAYGLPLGAVIVALGIGWAVAGRMSDAVALLLAAAGLIAGTLLGRHYLNRGACLREFVPTVSGRNA
jgi:sigma-E factor negative regulatory protein RseC